MTVDALRQEHCTRAGGIAQDPAGALSYQNDYMPHLEEVPCLQKHTEASFFLRARLSQILTKKKSALRGPGARYSRLNMFA